MQGFLLGAVNLGPVLPAYLQTFERNAQRYIDGLSLFFAVVIGERIVQMWLQGVLTEYRIWLGSTIALVTLLDLAMGRSSAAASPLTSAGWMPSSPCCCWPPRRICYGKPSRSC
ncbi:hypothetical protein [Saccharopolyspora endophytica]|uniref:Uncharacterized protein n=1 Tax=Saccharopolyspora endophytica TaxID=543886 RepID=A0ABS5DQT2_9PSEU|nr:hypothetical protein [Saccharopolyspora endophytica]MBQ0928664.1 hypothetical protein [Saccharopolyspora endophytica]